jgi:hypothetical protein
MQRQDSILFFSLILFCVAIIAFALQSRDIRLTGKQDLDLAQGQLLQRGESIAATPQQNLVIRGSLEFEAHVAELKRTTSDDFTIIIEKPFVVIGDQSPDQVKQWATGTIRWAVKQIKESYFGHDPDHIINIWLFKDKDSYEKNTLSLFGRKPTTPYGYYSPSDKALVMNISTGGGTLVHEIVHPFMSANFEACPSWFNEGLASLYEQSSERDGKIVGLTNWRLRGLQLAIHDRLLGSFEKLMSTNDREFYEGDATNYAQARYLCYWLQEQGLLRQYYHRFTKNADRDPEGIKTLQEILKVNDLRKFQTQWEEYVLKLRFR